MLRVRTSPTARRHLIWLHTGQASVQSLEQRSDLYSADASPTALSPSYIANFNPEEDEEDPNEDPTDYSTNERDNSDDESSDDDDVEKDEEDGMEGGAPSSGRPVLLIVGILLLWLRNQTTTPVMSVGSPETLPKRNQQHQQIKRQNTGRAYTAGSGDKKPYGGSRPLCSKCNYHHDGPCAPKCYKCNKYGHIARDCRGTGNANAVNNQRVKLWQVRRLFAMMWGKQGHYKRDSPEQKNQSHKNQIGGAGAHGVVHTLRGGETDQDHKQQEG
ncbi:reverse transcriptase [Tanacetum coccineum]